MTKKLGYRVIEKRGEYEIREYSPFLSIEVVQPGEWLQAGNRAFQPLVGYISGNNADARKFAMTAPVLQTEPRAGAHTVSFVLPVEAEAEVPQAVDSRVEVVRHAGGTFAAIAFSGRWSETLFMNKVTHLSQKLVDDGLEILGPALTARYDPPWKPGFARRNEILVPIKARENTKE